MTPNVVSTPPKTWALEPRLRFRSDAQVPAIEQLNSLAELTGLSFRCVDSHTGLLLSTAGGGLEYAWPWAIRSQLTGLTEGGPCQVASFASGLVAYAVPLSDIDDIPVAAVGCVLSGASPIARALHSQDSADIAAIYEFPEIVSLADANEWDEQQLVAWLKQLAHCDARLLRNMLNGATTMHRNQADHRREVDDLAEQVERAYAETSFVHSLTTRLQVSRRSLDVAEQCLDRLNDFVPAAASAIVFKPFQGRRDLLTLGKLPFPPADLLELIRQFEQHDWTRPIVHNQVSSSLFGDRFPELKNFVLVRISDGNHEAGWLFTCNSKTDFGAAEGNLLHSVATLVATHHRNREMYHELEDMLLQFISSLVSTLDAKDRYTRGHSERVAAIAKRLATELELPTSDCDDIHQAGLLHDIGKIGINDAVLQKPGKLTEAEFEHLKEHPVIGYRILQGLKRLDRVLPGVRHHHEDFAGTGYPDRLAGSEIPLMARILAVADAYDAMRSDRPYRKGMPIDRIEEIFRCGANQQWDPEVINAYFRARDDVRVIGDNGVIA